MYIIIQCYIIDYFSGTGYGNGGSMDVGSFITACRSENIDLTKAECVQIFNLLPSSVVEIHLVRQH